MLRERIFHFLLDCPLFFVAGPLMTYTPDVSVPETENDVELYQHVVVSDTPGLLQLHLVFNNFLFPNRK